MHTALLTACGTALKLTSRNPVLNVHETESPDGLGNCAKSWWLLYFKEAQNRAPVNLKIVKFVEEQ